MIGHTNKQTKRQTDKQRLILYINSYKNAYFTLRFCGSKLPHPLITTDSTMLLVFKSDASVQRKVTESTVKPVE